MFKWTKRRSRDHPSTPKLGNVSLPDELIAEKITAAKWSADLVPQLPTKPAFPDIMSGRRSKTPHPVSSKTSQGIAMTPRTRTPSLTSKFQDDILKSTKPMSWGEDVKAAHPPPAQSSRENAGSHMPRARTSSTSSSTIKGILKPPKSFPDEDFIKPVIALSHQRGRSYNFEEDNYAGSYKSTMKGGGYHSESEKYLKNTSSQSKRHGQMPLSDYHHASTFPLHPEKPGIRSDRHGASVHVGHSDKHSSVPLNPHQAPYTGHSIGHGVPQRSDPTVVYERLRLTNQYPASSRAGYSRHETPPSDLHRSPSSYTVPPAVHAGTQTNRHRGSVRVSANSYTPSNLLIASTHPMYPEIHGVATLDRHQSHHRSRHQSFGEHEAPKIAGPVLPKYVKPHITKVPQKEEAISLSWPFIEPAKRRRVRPQQPAIYFDIGFDPSEPSGIRALGSTYRALTEEERNIPASSHCVLTKMVISCHTLEHWPVVAERPEGLRCIDVFKAIYDTYAIPLTREEISTIGNSYIDACTPAFKQRCKDSPGLTLYNIERGMRRVDLLRTRRIFKCLTRNQDTATWTLEFDEPPQ